MKKMKKDDKIFVFMSFIRKLKYIHNLDMLGTMFFFIFLVSFYTCGTCFINMNMNKRSC